MAALGPRDVGQGFPEGQGFSPTLLFEEGSEEQDGHLGVEERLSPHPSVGCFLLCEKRDSAMVRRGCWETAPSGSQPPASLTNPRSLKSRWQPEISHGRSFLHRAGHHTLPTRPSSAPRPAIKHSPARGWPACTPQGVRANEVMERRCPRVHPRGFSSPSRQGQPTPSPPPPDMESPTGETVMSGNEKGASPVVRAQLASHGPSLPPHPLGSLTALLKPLLSTLQLG